MAHTCWQCGQERKVISAPTIEDSFERVNPSRLRFKRNMRYSHDRRSWKATSKARKQWARHLGA